MIKEGFNIKKEFDKILKPIKEPIDFIQNFIEGLIKVFEGIFTLLANSLLPFKGKGPLSSIPGLRIPVCFLNPFFVLAYMVVPKIKKIITESLMPATFPFRYAAYQGELYGDESFEQVNKRAEKFINDKITTILWIIFFMLALAFIFVPPIVGKFLVEMPEIINLLIPTFITLILVPTLVMQLDKYIREEFLFLFLLVFIGYSWRYIYELVDKTRDKVFNSKGAKGEPANPLLAKIQLAIDRALVSIPFIGQFTLSYYSEHRRESLIPAMPGGASINMMIRIINKACPACEKSNSQDKDRGDVLYRNIKAILDEFEVGYNGENSKLVHTIYLMCFYLWRLIIIPGVLLASINRLIRLDRTITDVVAALIAIFLGFIMIITAIILIPNPKCDPKVLGPARLVSKYITMVALPSFIVAWFFPELIEGCFECFKGVTLVNDGFNKMMGNVEKKKKEKKAVESKEDGDSVGGIGVGGIGMDSVGGFGL